MTPQQVKYDRTMPPSIISISNLVVNYLKHNDFQN